VLVKVPAGNPYVFFFGVGAAVVPAESRAFSIVESKVETFTFPGLEEPEPPTASSQIIVQGTKTEVHAALVSPDFLAPIGSRGADIIYEAVGVPKAGNCPLPYLNLGRMLNAESSSAQWATIKFDFAVKTVHQRLTLVRQIARTIPGIQLRLSGFEVRALLTPTWTWEHKATVTKIGGVKACFVDGRIPPSQTAGSVSPLMAEQTRAATEEAEAANMVEEARRAGGDVRILEIETGTGSDRTLLAATAAKLGEVLKCFSRSAVVRLSSALAVPSAPIVAVGARMALLMTASLRV
jgi:hypothetical protein